MLNARLVAYANMENASTTVSSVEGRASVSIAVVVAGVGGATELNSANTAADIIGAQVAKECPFAPMVGSFTHARSAAAAGYAFMENVGVAAQSADKLNPHRHTWILIHR